VSPMSNVANLLPSRSVVLSSHAGVTVRAERSGDGTRLRIVRESSAGFTVISDTAFGSR